MTFLERFLIMTDTRAPLNKHKPWSEEARRNARGGAKKSWAKEKSL